MLQVIQHLKTGNVEVVDVPAPARRRGHLLIATERSLISAGTERMLVDFGKANWIDKARRQPDKVKMVLDKIRTDGLVSTFEAVQSKLDEPMAMGYCNVGRVTEVGDGVDGFSPGQRVVSNGFHAEVVSVPANLCALVPEGTDLDAAAFTVVGAIALQGIRLLEPTLGETIVVTGLGLIGLLAVQLLRANGCRVIGLDVNPTRLAMARQYGAQTIDLSAGEDPVQASELLTAGRGVDGVLITASTSSSEPVHQAALMCRKRGRIVLVGVTGLELSRADFYSKELSFQVSCSYGPGRYDPRYEDKGQDYPLSYVRWTVQRNFEAIAQLIVEGLIDVRPLISHRFAIAEAGRAYDLLTSSEPSLGILLDYPPPSTVTASTNIPRTVLVQPPPQAAVTNKKVFRIAVLGAGNHMRRLLVPAFQKAGADIQNVASATGLSAFLLARGTGAPAATTDIDAIIRDPNCDAIVVATRHDSHAELTCRALEAG
ncbi:MAG: zinc-binding dehydrogenase, partial [Cyanobacteria bacterium REEB65]|nr:zinc-binding dehydrogenase [Cyanobacteria bacterium REEB65]